jgi:KUP system potassium uptake protein
MSDGHGGAARSSVAALTLGALGVVFGDIGTSPLYSVQTVFLSEKGLHPTPDNVYGILSLVFWSLTIIVSLKYVTFIMQAGNNGEGGIMALIALVSGTRLRTARGKLGLLALGIFGASLFYGDGMITPAISVLSAVEGLETPAPSLKKFVLPIAIVVLIFLFVIQRFGTGTVGALFGPVMCVWFVTLGALGINQIRHHPAVVRGLSPTYAVQFFVDNRLTGFLALGAVVLAVTGAEALYADMGHFGRPAIRRSWFGLVLPALFLNYMGQGAYILANHDLSVQQIAHNDDKVNAYGLFNPFFETVPSWGQIPMVVLATVATVIASQAVISGAFSVTRQAVQLGYLPRLTLRHTSSTEMGQIYVPAVNWFLFIAVLALVLGFRSSAALASAYGIAVTGTLAIDTILFFVVVRTLWKRPLWVAVAGAVGFLVVDLGFFSANTTKVASGGWFPLVVAAVVFTLLMTWRRGRDIVAAEMRRSETPITDYLATLESAPPLRVPGTAVFLTASGGGTPRALLHNVQHNHVLHEHVVLFTATTLGVPHVSASERITTEALWPGVTRVNAAYGFQDVPDVPRALAQAKYLGLEIEVEEASYFLNHVRIVPTGDSGLATWRKRLFTVISRNATNAASFFGLPTDQVVELGTQIEI